MNKIYKVIFCKRTGKRIAVSECTKSSGKQSGGKAAVCVAAAAFAAGVALLGVGQVAQAQTLPEAPCTANAGGTMYNANPTCVNYVNNTRIYLDSLSTSTSTGLSTTTSRVNSLSTGVSSLSTGLPACPPA